MYEGWLSLASTQPPLRDREEVDMNPLAYEGDESSPQPFCLHDACLRGACESQAPVPWLKGAASGARDPMAECELRQGGTALEARVLVAELGPWPRGAALRARTPFVENLTWLRGGTLEALVPTAGTSQ